MVVGSLVSLSLIGRYPRKSLYAVTTTVNIIGLLAMALYSYCKTFTDFSSFKYVPVVSLSLIIFVAMSARFPLTYVLLAELIPQNVRSLGVSMCIVVNWTLSFVLLTMFSTIVKTLQFHFCMFLFSGCTVLGLILVMLYVPETKNRSFEEIESSLTKKKRNFTSESQELKFLESEKS